jgi:cbb3-type cytochrome oxidase subunit 3
MMKAAVRALETGVLGQIGLVAFFLAFCLIVVYAFTLSRRMRSDAKQIPLNDPPEVFGPSSRS